VTRRDPERGGSNGVDEREQRLARARLAFDQGLREASETGARAARQLIVPALWGAALLGGTLLAFAMLRLVRRPNTRPALFHVSIEPHFASRPLLPVIGGAVARLAVRHWLGTPTSSGTDAVAHVPLAPKATPAGQQRTGSSHSNGSSNHGRAKA
jgi:hypothetical protein